MKNLSMFVYFILVLAIFCNCKGAHRIANTGEAVEHVTTFWKSANNIDTPYLSITQKAWYQDSIGITQICGINFVTINNVQSVNIATIGYRFKNLKKKWAYEYSSLSDTALIERKYRYADTTHFTGGWNFVNRISHPVDSFRLLPDTTIGAIIYKQANASLLLNKTRYKSVFLFRCDVKKTNFHINTVISNQIGCPLVFLRIYPEQNPHARSDEEIKLISNHFPDSIVKVFDAWKKNQIRFPVE
jgi:hypothetical protein